MEYLTPIELSEYIKKPKMWVYKHAYQFGIKQGGRWLFTKEWTDKFMEDQREIHLLTLRPYKRELPLNQMIHRKRRIRGFDPVQTQKRINKLILENPHFYSKSLVRSVADGKTILRG